MIGYTRGNWCYLRCVGEDNPILLTADPFDSSAAMSAVSHLIGGFTMLLHSLLQL
eukprot:COSAG05_NODE_2815_length_2610_cov_1.418957_2_plen_55_part_00